MATYEDLKFAGFQFEDHGARNSGFFSRCGCLYGNHAPRILQDTFNQQIRFRDADAVSTFKQIRIYNHIHDPGLVFETQEYESLPLLHNMSPNGRTYWNVKSTR